jgi:hypothetical protein
MSHVMPLPRREPMRTLHLLNTAIYLTVLLCWAGVLPAWRLAPEPVQPALQAALVQLVWPAMALGGAVLFVMVLRLAGWLGGRWDRAAGVVLQVGGILFACLALRAVAPLSFAGYSLGWNLVDAALHVGASLAMFLLPLIAVIAAIAGMVRLLRSQAETA